MILCFCHCKIRYWCRTGCRVHKSGTPFPRPYLAGVTFGNLHVFKHRPSWVSIKHRLEPTHSSTNVCRNHVLLLCNYFFSRETSTPLPASESKFRGGAGLRVKLHIEEVIHGRPFHSLRKSCQLGFSLDNVLEMSDHCLETVLSGRLLTLEVPLSRRLSPVRLPMSDQSCLRYVSPHSSDAGPLSDQGTDVVNL